MLDPVFTSHTCFGGHIDVYCKTGSKLVRQVANLFFSLPEMDYKNTCDTIYTHF